MPMLPPAIQPENTLLAVVDFQDRLLPAIHEADACVQAACRLIRACRAMDIPMLVTEQYPAGLGPTCATIKQEVEGAPVIEKTRFSSCTQPVMEQLNHHGRPMILVVGIEAHVCVQQTVLDLLRLGYTPFVCADGISSRRPLDRDMAIARMRQAGAIVTTVESATFELLGEAGTDLFRRVLKIVK